MKKCVSAMDERPENFAGCAKAGSVSIAKRPTEKRNAPHGALPAADSGKTMPQCFNFERDEIDLTVTDKDLMEAAQCAHRMTGYANPDERLLIAKITSDNGTQIRLILDRHCLKKYIDSS